MDPTESSLGAMPKLEISLRENVWVKKGRNFYRHVLFKS
jgi:hypothetical protein